MKTKFKQDSYRLREIEVLLQKARKRLLFDNSEKAVLDEIRSALRIWDSLDKSKLQNKK